MSEECTNHSTTTTGGMGNTVNITYYSKCHSCLKTECIHNPNHVCRDYTPEYPYYPYWDYPWRWYPPTYVGDVPPWTGRTTCIGSSGVSY